MSRVLVAGMGNVLRRDDGFGVEVAQRLAASAALPDGVTVIEVGIGGVHLVQELMNGYDALVVIDAIERGSVPGTVHVLTADVPDLTAWSDDLRDDFLADTHYTTPSKALILAKALGVLPPRVFFLGCQPDDAEALGIGLTQTVEQAATEALGAIEQLVRRIRGESAAPPPAVRASTVGSDDG